MSFNLVEKSIEELSTYLNRGIPPKYCDDDGLLVINQRCIRDQVLTLDDARLHDVSKKSVSEEKYVQKYDVLVNSTGVGTLGRVAQVEFDLEATVDTHVTIVRPNEEIVDPHYFGFLMRSIQYKIERLASGSTGQTELRRTALSDISVQMIDDLDVQKDIASQLSVLDQKIHLNQQTNETLEAMAQAIFKSWFVDFDPVRAKIEAKSAGRDPNRAAMAAIAGVSVEQDWDEIEAALEQKLGRMSADQRTQLRQTGELFPDELVESEIGEVPKGWEYDQLGNYITVKRGGSPRPIKDFVVDEGFHWTKIADATSENSPFLLKTKEFIKEEGLKKTVLLVTGSLILSNSATPGLPKFLNIDACIHDGWLYFPEKKHFSDLYLYHLFIEIRKALVAKGSGSVFTNLKTSILREYDVVVPDASLIVEFTNLAQSLFSTIKLKRMETENLTNLRDTLLPKLISGEIQL